MQFRLKMAGDPDPEKNRQKSDKYDCTSCQGERHHCLNEHEEIEIDGLGTINKGNWLELFDRWRDDADRKAVPDWALFELLDICPLPLLTGLSIELWNLYNALDGFGNLGSPKEYYALPALYVFAVGVIREEVNKVSKYK